MEIILIRHGESEHNARSASVRDCSITALGREQAQRAAKALADYAVKRVFCSPQRRAMETGAYLADQHDVEMHLWPEITENGFSGEEPGLSRSEIARIFPRVVLPEWVDEAGCLRHWGDEETEALSQRTRKAAEQFRAWAAEEAFTCIACIIHGTSGSWILRHLLQTGLDGKVGFPHHNCGITRLRIDAEGNVMVNALNETGHLAGLPLRTPHAESASY